MTMTHPRSADAVHGAACKPRRFARHRTVRRDCPVSGLTPLKGAIPAARQSRIRGIRLVALGSCAEGTCSHGK
jgi:hypothetical protein